MILIPCQIVIGRSCLEGRLWRIVQIGDGFGQGLLRRFDFVLREFYVPGQLIENGFCRLAGGSGGGFGGCFQLLLRIDHGVLGGDQRLRGLCDRQRPLGLQRRDGGGFPFGRTLLPGVFEFFNG